MCIDRRLHFIINHLDITKHTVLITVDHLSITTFCFYVFQIVIVVVITFIGQRTLGKHLDEDESTPDKSLEEESLCTAHFRFPI